MKTVEEYLAAIDETFARADASAMKNIVEDLRGGDRDMAYDVLTTAMGIGASSTSVDLKKVGWVHRHAVETVLEILRERELAGR